MSAVEYKQKPVSAAVWPWAARRQPRPVETGQSTAKRAIIQAVIAAAVTAFFFWKGHRILGGVVGVIGAYALVTGLFMPKAFHAFERAGQWLGKIVGTGLTYGLLVPFFYLCFVPAHFLMNLLKKDPLQLRFNEKAESYWTKRPPVTDVEQFKRQY